ncbi:MAG: TIGR01212 family radical SAM protein [Ruminococcaceae bacterium]|nr:TIGR01212 family radical SAM protein [Oscillospiraceae bacterium]
MKNPFPNSDTNKRYYSYNYYLRRTYGKKCRRIPLDGGFTCPNRDGSKGVGGCAFCSAKGSGDFTASGTKSILEQYKEVSASISSKWDDNSLNIPYFQSYTGTYAPLSVLSEKYEEALKIPNIAELCIATRADCLEDDTVRYIGSIAEHTPVMLELGLQSVHDRTAELMNRGHTFEEFVDGYNKVRTLAPNVRLCVHLIFGLPGENRDMMLESVRKVAQLKPDAVKLHLLHVIKDTRLAEMYVLGEFETMSLDSYAQTVVSALELLPPDTVICRVTGDGAPDELIAPDWSRKKFVVMNTIDKLMVKLDTWQGKRYNIE